MHLLAAVTAFPCGTDHSWTRVCEELKPCRAGGTGKVKVGSAQQLGIWTRLESGDEGP